MREAARTAPVASSVRPRPADCSFMLLDHFSALADNVVSTFSFSLAPSLRVVSVVFRFVVVTWIAPGGHVFSILWLRGEGLVVGAQL